MSLCRNLAILAGTSTIAATIAFGLFDYRLNVTPSYPLGIYQLERRAPELGELTLTCPPQNHVVSYGIGSGFIPSPKQTFWMHAPCPYSLPVMKRVAALGGARITIKGEWLEINGLPSSLMLNQVPTYHVAYELKPNEALLLAEHKDSFDGRYWGPSNADEFHGTMRPIFIF
ncbi:MAG: S26 family signal peptidase [Ferrimonas sp.]